jgi:hypothetical protein
MVLSNMYVLGTTGTDCSTSSALNSRETLIAGGQNGTWFKLGQTPRLYKIALNSTKIEREPTFESQGTIWSGSHNGTHWLISGWGSNRYGANPPIMIYDSRFLIVYRSTDPDHNSSWYGGDIFASSYGRNQWLISGMGSGPFSGMKGNHMTLATLDGSKFKDLTKFVPRLQLGILYANEWNGTEWMIGGGGDLQGVLFTFDGTKIQDLTSQASKSVKSFGPVTSLAWNGTDWLIGGVQSLYIYHDSRFIDVTNTLAGAVGKEFYSVNAISWDQQDRMWLLGGGLPKANVKHGRAWIATLSSSNKARDLTALISCYLPSEGSSILTSSFAGGLWALGGFGTRDNHPLPVLLVISLPTYIVNDFSQGLEDLTYVIWVKFATSDRGPTKMPSKCGSSGETIPTMFCRIDQMAS